MHEIRLPKRSRQKSLRTAGLVLILALVFSVVLPVSAAPGDLDTSFGLSSSGITYTDIGALTGDKALAMALQDDGKIVVAGSSGAGIAVTRYTSAGLLDVSFSGDGKQTVSIGGIADVANAIAIQDTGEIVLAGSSSNGLKTDFALVRLTSGGVLDTSFNGTGKVITTLSTGNDAAYAIALQTTGEIVVAGQAGTEFGVARYTTSGSLDASFGGGSGFVTTTFFSSGEAAYAVAIQPDDMILVAGSTNNSKDDDFALARYTTTGALDTSFGGGDGKVNTNFTTLSNDFAYSLALQSDGKPVVAGVSDSTDEDFALARYTTSGDLDPTFSGDGRQVTAINSNNDQARTVIVQPTGKIVATGLSFSLVNFTDFTIARYTASGELDAGFGSGGIVVTDLGPILSGSPGQHTDDLAYAAALQTDNNILVAGYTDYPLANGDNNFAVARYLSPNTAPTLADVPKSGLEDTVLTFSSADFSAQFFDPDGDGLQKVMITDLPASGVLRLNGLDVILNQEILSADLGNLTYQPVLNVTGPVSFGWNGFDGLDYAVLPALVNITLTGVNDAPSFVAGPSKTVLEDAGAQTYPSWASAISSGPADESSQALTFIVSTDNNSLFAVLPAVNPVDGSLTFTPAANANGFVNCNVSLKDNGGTANGGLDTSNVQTFTITISPVNDAPAFLKGIDQNTPEDSGQQVIGGWATAISPGPTPDEAGQTVAFLVSNDNPVLFAAAPALTPTGELSYTPATNANGNALVSVRLQDNGGTASGGVDTSSIQTFNITITSVNDAPQVSNVNKVGTANAAMQFFAADFTNSFSDLDGDSLAVVSIASLPAHGVLTLDGIAVALGQEIPVASLAGLVFTPDPSWQGDTSYNWNGSDGTLFAALPAQVNITIQPEPPKVIYLPLVNR